MGVDIRKRQKPQKIEQSKTVTDIRSHESKEIRHKIVKTLIGVKSKTARLMFHSLKLDVQVSRNEPSFQNRYLIVIFSVNVQPHF